MNHKSDLDPDTNAVRTLAIDTEHFSIRFLVPVLAVGLALMTHVIGMSRLDDVVGKSVDVSCIVVPLDFVVLFVAGFAADRILKRVLPSRRSATLNDEAFVLTDARRRPPQITRIAWSQAVNVNAWWFVVRRRTRVPKGWYCLAIHLLQDETAVICYTFMSPTDAEALPNWDRFVRLRPRRETQTSTDLRWAAEQRRLLKLEDARWQDGAEIGAEDFRAVLAMVRQYVPAWMK